MSIFAFPAEPTVRAGAELVLHVSCDAPGFVVEVHRFGSAVDHVATFGPFDGRPAPPGAPYEDWSGAWPSYRLTIDSRWRPGVYVAVLREGPGPDAIRPDAIGPDAIAPDVIAPETAAASRCLDARSHRALFVVAPAPGTPRAPVLVKLPLFTWHAYASSGGWSFYTYLDRPRDAPRVPGAASWRRPGGGTGGLPSDLHNTDPFDPTPRQTFVHWDAPFLAWLERHGVDHEVCTDLDLHRDRDGSLLAGRRLLASAGHDEYWSDAMRAHADRFVDGGGNLAFFGGNTCWWRVEVDDVAHRFCRVTTWAESGRLPENTTTGVSFRNGGERDGDEHPVAVGFRVQHADHWVHDGTGLGDGDVYGDGPGEYVVGYECDGAHFDRAAWARTGRARPTGDDGTRPTFTILGVGDLRPSGWGFANAAATLGVDERGGGAGTVFTAATTDWPRLLAGPRPHPVVERITANVVDRLGRPR